MPTLATLLASAAFAAIVFSAQAQESSAAPEVLHDGLLKVNLTDFISGKYSLSYEHVLGNWSSVEATVTGIGMTMAARTVSKQPTQLVLLTWGCLHTDCITSFSWYFIRIPISCSKSSSYSSWGPHET